jgi:hypothetical protein
MDIIILYFSLICNHFFIKVGGLWIIIIYTMAIPFEPR